MAADRSGSISVCNPARSSHLPMAAKPGRPLPPAFRQFCRYAVRRRPITKRSTDMPRYVDGFVIPVPKKNLDAYRRLAQKAGKIWREHGALEVRECVAEDVKVGKLTSFPRSVKKKPD